MFVFLVAFCGLVGACLISSCEVGFAGLGLRGGLLSVRFWFTEPCVFGFFGECCCLDGFGVIIFYFRFSEFELLLFRL